MRVFLSAAFSLCLSFPALADTDAMIERYNATLQMDKVFEILREEGIAASSDVTQQEDGITPSRAWILRLEQIYQTDKMRAAFEHGMRDVPNIEASSAALDFLETPLGERLIRIELEARRALMDDSVEDGMRDQVKRMRKFDPQRLRLYTKFIRANDLIESNVAGALNSNIAFYRGLATSPDFRDTMNDSFILSTVMEQEREIRKDTEEWMMNFSALAYAPLSAEEIWDYIDISNTDAGQKLNAVLFSGFDKLFEMQSYELGRAMGEFMIGEDT